MAIVLDPGVANPAAPTSAVSSDGRLTAYTDVAHGGMLLFADFSDLATKPVKVRFVRAGGVAVRSGDSAWAPGGQAWAYDHEAPLGSVGAWVATPVFADGSTGTPSTTVALGVPSMAAGVDCWVKPINNPGLSVAFPVYTDRVEIGWSGRTQSYAVPGRSLPIGTYDRRSMNVVSITMRTTTKADKDALNAALDVGPVLVQLRDSYGIDDFYAIPADSSERYVRGMFSQLRDIPSSFIPCDRPPTIDAPLFIPGVSWDDPVGMVGSWDLVAEQWATWNSILFGSAPIATGLLEETGSGDDEGSL